MSSALKDWVASRPGPLSGRTHDEVWDMAWRNFRAGPTGNLDNEMMFRHTLIMEGYGVRALAVGGFALDRVS